MRTMRKCLFFLNARLVYLVFFALVLFDSEIIVDVGDGQADGFVGRIDLVGLLVVEKRKAFVAHLVEAVAAIHIEALLLLHLDGLVEQEDGILVVLLLDAKEREVVVGEQDLPLDFVVQAGVVRRGALLLLESGEEVFDGRIEVLQAFVQYATLHVVVSVGRIDGDGAVEFGYCLGHSIFKAQYQAVVAQILTDHHQLAHEHHALIVLVVHFKSSLEVQIAFG